MFIPVSPVSAPCVDYAAPGRLRRLALTAASPLLLLILPMALAALHGERLPGRIYFGHLAIGTEHALTWRGWISQPQFGVALWSEALLVLPFLSHWRLPQVQRVLVIVGFTFGAPILVSGVLWTLKPVQPPWSTPAEIICTVVAAAVGYRAAGTLPRPPEATAAPPPYVPTMALRSGQRAMFVTSTWSARRLLTSAVLAGFTVWNASRGADVWQLTALLALWTALEVAQARTRLQIDGSGVTVRFLWLPALRRTVPYPSVRFAEAMSEAPPGRYKLSTGVEGWGIVSGKGPALVLALADGRRFVYSTSEAETAAALVNGWLSRERQGGTASC
ncbi:hypothetical protein GCM10022226_27420 [Sphaerisporangium flaviroseum]|uniref:Uncharacterized protein n=1 Tax=Sphaerisporangium flaviroseum TaxID=509199 RepID=A0ABP7I4C0_9ACTN